MKLKWYGQASFRITASDGTSIVTDPYDPDLAGYKPVTEPADIVVRSSDNDSFHCRAELISGDPVVVEALELAKAKTNQTVKGITFTAIEAMEALNHKYHDPDQNGMYRFEVDGISIGHMGDIGNPLSEEQIAFFEDLDVLLALAGGHPVLELDDLKTLIDEAKPRLVVPMHFRTLTYKMRDMHWISAFLSYFPDEAVDFAFAAEVELKREELPDPTRVLVVDYVQY